MTTLKSIHLCRSTRAHGKNSKNPHGTPAKCHAQHSKTKAGKQIFHPCSVLQDVDGDLTCLLDNSPESKQFTGESNGDPLMGVLLM